MKLLNSLLLFILFLSNQASANDVIKKLKELKVVHYSQLGTDDEEYFAYVLEDKTEHQFKVIDKKNNELLRDSFPILTDGFKSLSMFDIGDESSPYLAVITQRGIHGENLLLYSLPKKKLIKNFASTLPVIWRSYENHISIEVAGPKKSDGIETKEVIEFPANKK